LCRWGVWAEVVQVPEAIVHRVPLFNSGPQWLCWHPQGPGPSDRASDAKRVRYRKAQCSQSAPPPGLFEGSALIATGWRTCFPDSNCKSPGSRGSPNRRIRKHAYCSRKGKPLSTTLLGLRLLPHNAARLGVLRGAAFGGALGCSDLHQLQHGRAPAPSPLRNRGHTRV
jgi:hypothetical protein